MPKNYERDLTLSRWVRTQRLANRSERLSEERKAALDSLGFDFRIQDSHMDDTDDTALWDIQFSKLRVYRDLNGDCDVPSNYGLDPELARWVNKVRLSRVAHDGLVRGLIAFLILVWCSNAR